MNANEESPGRSGGVRQQSDGGMLPPDIASRTTRYSWLQLCVISSVGLAVGVIGTAAYMLWFSHDQQAYAEAVQTARHPQAVSTPTTVVRNDAVTGRITPAAPKPGASMNGTNGTSVTNLTNGSDNGDVALVATQSPAMTTTTDDAQKAACAAPAASAAAPARVDRNKLVAGTNRRAPPRVKQKETLIARLGSMLRPVGYHNRGTGNNQDPYSHP